MTKVLSLMLLTALIGGFAQSAQPNDEEANSNSLNTITSIPTRIIFEDEIEMESSPSSPPLATDDPGTPGAGGVEVNLVTECDRSSGARGCEYLVDANLGIGDNIQLKVERPYEVEKADGEPTHRAMGATEVGVKWRFYNKGKTQLAIYPNFSFNDAGLEEDAETGEPLEREGHVLYIPLIISRGIGSKYTVVTNVGRTFVLKRPEEDGYNWSVAIGRAITDTSRIMGEVVNERDKNFNNRGTEVRIGYAKLLFGKEDTQKYEASVVTSVGTTVGSTDDGRRHTTYQFGISLVKKPRQ